MPVPDIGVFFYICGLYVIIIIIIIIITRGVSVYFTYCGREKIKFNWMLKKQLVKSKIAIS
jgi:peroxiredoxin family protein